MIKYINIINIKNSCFNCIYNEVINTKTIKCTHNNDNITWSTEEMYKHTHQICSTFKLIKNTLIL